ncbi:MAG: energy-coupling factor transport system substrate-specific component [Solirubrobacteraceae bacterium]|nr:energy-coupling factor transport system substrate-specific component [Solirubrobacteraceae bacterium]
MSWELASFLVLFVALAAGFRWYEHGHPSSKVLALVATLAALAALGRVAFAPLPNVKPTTDIVLLSGFALGGAPGFVVGAAGALASNLFFGQGPWTPWQMGAWGLVGVIGALLGAATGRRMGRVPLALACCAAGFVYGAILDFSTWTTFSGEHTLGQFLVINGTSLPFNVAHAVGNLLFCLAFGPAFVRALLRYRERFEVRFEPLAVAAAAIAAVVLALAALPAEPARAADAATTRATRYVLRARNADGGFGAKAAQRSAALETAWASMGLAAAGRAPSPATARFLGATAPRVNDTGDIERTILGVVAAGGSPRRAGGVNLVSKLIRRRRPDGSFERLVNRTAFAVLALRAAGRSTRDGTVRKAAAWVVSEQNRDGGWNFGGRGAPSGVDDTAGALQALVAAGRSRRGAVARAATFIARTQNSDGGFPLQPGAGSNAQSTAWAVQALVAAGRNPDRVRRGGSRSPLGYLRTLVASDGSVRYSRTSAQTPVWVTAQALTALARRPFPIRAPRGRR